MCAHREPAYPRGTWSCAPGRDACDCPDGACARLAASEAAQDRSLILPLFSQMSDDDQIAVSEAVRDACRAR